MNNNIKELYNQVVGKDWAYDFDPLMAEKFAELIVKECIDYCGENLSKTVGGALKIHFGVEE